jgi:hypothetical protein
MPITWSPGFHREARACEVAELLEVAEPLDAATT